MTRKEWTKDEINFLINNAKKMSYEEMGIVLGRSKKSVFSKLSRITKKATITNIEALDDSHTRKKRDVPFKLNEDKIKLNKDVRWNREEIAFLREHSDKNIYFIAQELNRSVESIQYKFKSLKISRRREIWSNEDKIKAMSTKNNMIELLSIFNDKTEFQIREFFHLHKIEILPYYASVIDGKCHIKCSNCKVVKEHIKENFNGGGEGLVCSVCMRKRNCINNWKNKYGVILDEVKMFDTYNILEWYALKRKIGFRSYPREIATKENLIILGRHIIEKEFNYHSKNEIKTLQISLIDKFISLKSIYKHYTELYEWMNDIYPEFKFNSEDFKVIYLDDGITRCGSYKERDIYNYISDNFDTDVTLIGNNRSKGFYNEFYNENYYPDFKITKYKDVRLDKDIIIEYYGLYNPNVKGKNMVTRYNSKTHRKNNYYKRLDNIIFIDLYPFDLNDGFKGLNHKIKYALKGGEIIAKKESINTIIK